MLNRKKVLMTCLILLLMVSGIGIVSAETINGNIGDSSTVSRLLNNTGGSSTSTPVATFQIPGIESSGGLSAVIRFTTVNSDIFAAGALIGNSVPLTATLAGHTYGNGTIGYQRVMNNAVPPVDIAGGYIWMTFDSWNITGQTGSKNIVLNYNSTLLGLTGEREWGGPTGGSAGNGTGVFWSGTGGWLSGLYVLNYYITETAAYSFVKPSGLSIAGLIDNRVGNSRVFIRDGTTGAVISSDSTYNTNNFSVNTIAQSIYLSLLGSSGTWYNSSLLFSSPTPTVTPTVTVTPVDPFGITPPGYVRSMCQNTDSETDGAVHYSNVSIRDVQNSSWNNVTSRFDGTWYIDTLPGHTIDCYGSAPGYTSASRLGLPASQSMMYELFLMPGYVPPASSGKVRLYVLVNDRQTSAPINGALVTISGSGQTTVSQTTGKSGDVVLEWANLSTVYATASKYGYESASRTLTTTANGPDTLRIELNKNVITVAPTSTIPPGGVTPAVTMDTRSSNEKDLAMMDMIRSAGPQLISIAIAATAFGLLGLIMKSMKF